MLYLKECTRCQGDLHWESDRYGTYLHCLQCGFIPTDAQADALIAAQRRAAQRQAA